MTVLVVGGLVLAAVVGVLGVLLWGNPVGMTPAEGGTRYKVGTAAHVIPDLQLPVRRPRLVRKPVLEGMAQHYFAEHPRERVLLCTEIMSEARRHPEIARISAAFDADVRKWLTDLLRAGVACGDIPGDVDLDGAVTMLMLIADGVWWRRALDPQFDAEAVVPMFMDVARHLLRGRPKALSNGKNLDKKSVPDITESTL